MPVFSNNLLMPYIMIYFLTGIKDDMFFGPWNGIAQANALVFGSIFVGGQKFANMVREVV